MTQQPAIPQEAKKRAPRLLFVDDEPNILSSLRRLFRPLGYEVFTAGSGQEGLDFLAENKVDMVVSDMRMPEMDGARFLEHVRERWPDTMRLLLTGYADIQSILDAINRGEIYRYITKPWDDNDILLVVRQALERQALEYERKYLEALTQSQNDELQKLNASLEAKVEARTRDLKRAHDGLIATNRKLKINFLTSIKVFSQMIELRSKNQAGHSRRVADLSHKMAVKMALDPQETQEIFVAGLLHNIGKIGFADEMLTMPSATMNGTQLGIYRKYPAMGEQLLFPLEDLRGSARLIRAHQERFDGQGYPDRLSAFNIPLGARILAITSDYDNLQLGLLMQRSMRPDEALATILQHRGTRYDPALVAAFQEVVTGAPSADVAHEEAVPVMNLRAGMVIARDVVTKDGFLLLSADHELSERLIQQLTDYENTSEQRLTVYVKSELIRL